MIKKFKKFLVESEYYKENLYDKNKINEKSQLL